MIGPKLIILFLAFCSFYQVVQARGRSQQSRPDIVRKEIDPNDANFGESRRKRRENIIIIHLLRLRNQDCICYNVFCSVSGF